MSSKPILSSLAPWRIFHNMTSSTTFTWLHSQSHTWVCLQPRSSFRVKALKKSVNLISLSWRSMAAFPFNMAVFQNWFRPNEFLISSDQSTQQSVFSFWCFILSHGLSGYFVLFTGPTVCFWLLTIIWFTTDHFHLWQLIFNCYLACCLVLLLFGYFSSGLCLLGILSLPAMAITKDDKKTSASIINLAVSKTHSSIVNLHIHYWLCYFEDTVCFPRL